MNRKLVLVLYTVIMSLINILVTGALIVLVFLLLYLLLRFALNASPEMYVFAMLASLVIGMMAGFFVYSKVLIKLVKVFHLEPYLTKTSKGKGDQSDSQEEKHTYVLPSSALDNEEDDKWKE